MKEWIKEHMILISAMVVGSLVLIYYFISPVTETQLKVNPVETGLPTETPKTSTERKEVKTIMADVKGAIKIPGVYEVKEGERVIDIISKAGGLTDQADQTKVNFSMYVTDEMVLYIPKVGEVEQPDLVPSGANQKETMVNINKADQSELETLPGIGPSKSMAIIEYRNTNGPYQTIEDIQSVGGFGEKTFEKLKDKISVK